MTETFYGRFINLRTKILGIRTKLGDPRLRQLAFQVGDIFVFIDPVPKVSTPDPTSYYPTNIDERLNRRSWQTDIPRSYERDFIDSNLCYLDAEIVDGQMTGILCRAQVLSSESGLSWNVRIFEEYFKREEDIQDGIIGL